LDASLTGAPALQQAQEAGSYRSKELVRSLVERYSQGLAHEEQIEELNNKWRRKEREWDLNAEVRLAVTSRNQL